MVGVLVVGVQVLLAHVTRTESINALRDRADAAVTTVRGTPEHPRVLDVPADSLDQNLWIYDLRGNRIDGHAPSPGLARAVASLSRTSREASQVVSGRYRLLALPARSRGRGPVAAVVVAGVDLAPYESSERRGLWLSLTLGGLIVVAAGTASWAAARYSLRQVRQMARRADDWREHDLSGRFALGPPREELTELAQTLDRMLDRISRAIVTERRLTDEVAHELRTPLTAIRSEAELALLDPNVPDPTRAALLAVVRATEQMNQSISTILTVARSAHAEDRTSTTAAAVLDEVRHRVTGREGVTITMVPGTSPVPLAAPQAVVVAALAPLVDNAVRHARTAVTVEARTVHPRVHLVVEDDGDGVRAEDAELVFSPGYTSAGEGAGLGLALARRLAHSVGGVVRAEPCGNGRFVIDLPGT
ncbi:ATP-binding protein [Actinopolymorpha rutila]|uniref:histidine kinase n=1 Tax=Actinopolymorpha rutila TaxID=446787 RepID=A0A852ZE42_9ACTN|nr:signal transduction histidine kinase [Actinopolymorpha rutila]